MKNFKLIVSTLLISSMLIACKKKDATLTNVVNAKISQVIETEPNSPARVYPISYDVQNRNSDWAYEGQTVTKTYNSNGRVLKYQHILNSEGLAIEGNFQTSQTNTRTRYTYDSQKRITKITVDEQYVNSNGTPTTNFKLTYSIDITWDNNNNISTAKKTYTGDGNNGNVSYWIYTFEGYAANIPNTLKAANIGLDIFGPQGYPSNIEHSNPIAGTSPLYAGKQLPAKLTRQAFAPNNTVVGEPIIYNYNYEKDKQGRIALNSFSGVSYRYSYK